MNLDRLLNEIMPYRMQAVATLNLATCLRMKWADHPQPLEIHVNGKLQVEGNLHAFTNPAIEAGLVHCRAAGVSRADREQKRSHREYQ